MLPGIATDPIEVSVTAGQVVTVRHGLGRQLAGFLVVWRSAPCDFHIHDPAADTSREVALVPSGTADVRLVLL